MLYSLKVLLGVICLGSTWIQINSANNANEAPISISFLPQPDSVIINQSLTIRCHINLMADSLELLARSSMFLYCPIKDRQTFCFQNCKPASDCTDDGSNNCEVPPELAKVQCRIIKKGDKEITYEYTVRSVTPAWLGIFHGEKRINSGFACYSGGIKSHWVQLHEMVIIEDVGDSATTRSSSTMAANAVNQRQVLTRPVDAGIANVQQLEPTVLNRGTTLNSAKENIIVAALIGVTVSLLLNAFWCIRHVLIRHYADSDKKVPMKSLFCMTKEIRNARQFRKVNQIRNGSEWKGSKNVKSSEVPGFMNMQTPGYRNTSDASFMDAANSDESFRIYGGVQRAHPEGKATNSTISNSFGRNSTAELSAMSTPLQLYNAAGQPVAITGGLYALNSANTNMPFQRPSSRLASQYVYLSQQKLQQIHLDESGHLYQIGNNYSELYDPSQRSFILNNTSRPNSRVVSNQREIQPGKLYRALSKETVLSGFVIQPRHSLREAPPRLPAMFDSQTVSDRGSLDYSGQNEMLTGSVEPTEVVGYCQQNLQSTVIIDGPGHLTNSQMHASTAQQETRLKNSSSSQMWQTNIFNKNQIDQDIDRIARDDDDENVQLVCLTIDPDSNVSAILDKKLPSEILKQTKSIDNQRYSPSSERQGKNCNLQAENEKMLSSSPSGIRNWLKIQ